MGVHKYDKFRKDKSTSAKNKTKHPMSSNSRVYGLNGTGQGDRRGKHPLKPVSHCGELGLRVYYEYWRVITRQKIREFAVISYDCGMSATSARVLFDISTRCVR